MRGSSDASGECGFLPEPFEQVMLAITESEMDLPHIVICRCTSTGESTYSGPYPSGLAALIAAEHEYAITAEPGTDLGVAFHVAALYPATYAWRE